MFERYGYAELRTPVIEREELFSKGTGESTDIVQKEMYTFTDKGGERITLRPEATPSMARAYIEHNLENVQPSAKLYAMGPMFRYERPQKGRYRQFHQLDVEVFGMDDPAVDAEVIDLRSLDRAGLDWATVEASVRKTGNVLIVEQGAAGTSFGGWLADEVQRRCFDWLDQPVARVQGGEASPSVSKVLETAAATQQSDIEAALRNVMANQGLPIG